MLRRIAVLVVGFFLVEVLFGAVLVLAFMKLGLTSRVAIDWIAAGGITAGSLLLAFLLCRWDRRPWSEIALPISSAAPAHFAAGLLAVGVVFGAAGLLCVGLGLARLAPPHLGLSNLGASTWLVAGAPLVLQGFPEEVAFRGYLLAALRDRLSMRTSVLLCAGVFGLIHIASHGGTDGPAQQFVYMVHAAGLGLLAGALRAGLGTVWAAAGVHTGFHVMAEVVLGLTPTGSAAYTVELLVMTSALTLGAVAVLRLAPGSVAAPAKPAYQV